MLRVVKEWFEEYYAPTDIRDFYLEEGEDLNKMTSAEHLKDSELMKSSKSTGTG